MDKKDEMKQNANCECRDDVTDSDDSDCDLHIPSGDTRAEERDTIIVFDLDNTLLPTSVLYRRVKDTSTFTTEIRAIAVLVRSMLTQLLSLRRCHIHIVTLCQPAWIDRMIYAPHGAGKFLRPLIDAKLVSLSVLGTGVSVTTRQECHRLKAVKMREILMRHRHEVRNIMTVGDSDWDHSSMAEAVRHVRPRLRYSEDLFLSHHIMFEKPTMFGLFRRLHVVWNNINTELSMRIECPAPRFGFPRESPELWSAPSPDPSLAITLEGDEEEVEQSDGTRPPFGFELELSDDVCSGWSQDRTDAISVAVASRNVLLRPRLKAVRTSDNTQDL